MRIIEISKNETVLCRAFYANNFFTRLRGLIGRTLDDNISGLLLVPCNQVHTFNMTYPIDILYLAKDGTVLKIDAKIPPSKVLKTVKKAHSVLELRSGAAEQAGIQTGDRLLHQ
ncbi:MAG TPA: DUF192 domain-containing protein [Oscillospiraceae bacterium]|nr:DUF192 domain-containing protein [Oscillospiraceae bacterium]HPF55307.1 DUF192 domain-containing protein [Clostridiales bacterium]HPK34710.1 DUF192 domain-containing protein [Oscillospiraceae bacterium]HPR74526.1 DUF192 domain-containing protein [Oscillospiraceae bacterium]